MNWCRAALLSLLLVMMNTASALAADNAEQQLGEFIPTKTPQPAPDVSFVDADGKMVPLSQFKGKPVLVNLWATWCQPCVEEMPALDRLQESLGDKLTVLAISEDHGGSKVVQAFVNKLGFPNLKIFLDPSGKFGDAFKVYGLPTSIMIDDAGKVRGRVVGIADWDDDAVRAKIAPFLTPTDSGDTLKSSSR
jgi:thiol-disulfide isomerase/thioredoxin